ncbi:MAG: tyrosine-type recombinase/integrase [Erysipelotrichaceae bacterium]
MAAYKEKAGTWMSKMSFRDSNGKVISKTKRGFTKKRDALDYEDEFRKSKIDVINTTMRFCDLFEEYMKNKQDAIVEITENEYRRMNKQYFDKISKKKLVQLTPKDLLDVRNDLLKLDLSKSYKNKIIKLLKSISKFGYNFYDFKDNAKQLKMIPVNSDDVKDYCIWTPEEFELFISHVDQYVCKAFFTFLYHTGARLGEAKALLVTDIQNGKATISKSMKHYVEGPKPLKTLSSRRTIQLDNITLEVLKPLLETSTLYLFGDLEPVSLSNLQRSFKKALTASGLKRATIHDLRHSHASYLIGNGANVVAVSKRLGHSDVNMTLKVYTHILKESEDKLLAILNQ